MSAPIKLSGGGVLAMAGLAAGAIVIFYAYKKGVSIRKAISDQIDSAVAAVNNAVKMGQVNSPQWQIDAFDLDKTGAMDSGTGMSQDTLDFLGLSKARPVPSASALKNSLYAEQGVANLL